MPFNHNAIDQLLEETDLTIETLAQELGITRTNLQTSMKNWRGEGNPTVRRIDELYCIAQRYGSSVEFYEKPR